ncbi:MAG: peptidoglycan-binding domain-containing protein [bacterium]|nr:peptidoglycan-binding domain-containing protein [bacterium]
MVSSFHKHIFLTSVVAVFVFISAISSVSAAISDTNLQNQINALLEKLQTTPVISFTECVVPSAPLAFGSYGSEVKKLQVWLGQHGYQVVQSGKESQYFGPLTHFALIKFQSAAGIRPVSGFYGPLTQMEIKKRCAIEEVSRVGLKVSPAADSPKGETVPAVSTRIEVLKINLSGKSALDSLTIHRYGTGEIAGFSKVYLFDGGVRLTSGHLFDDANNTVKFENLHLAIDGTKTLTVMADISKSNLFSEEGVEVVSAGAFGASGIITGSFPIRGGLFDRTNEKVGSLTIEKNGTLSDSVIGRDGVKVAEFRVVPKVSEDVLLRSVTLTRESSFDSSLISNFVLKQNKVTVAFAAAVNSRNQILLRLDEPLTLVRNTAVTFELYADLAPTIKPDATLRIYLQSPIDFYATGKTAEKGVAVVSSKYNNSAGNGSDASWMTIKDGAVTYTFQGPSVAHYAVDQHDVELMRFDLKSQSNIEMREMRILLTAGGSDAVGSLTTVGGLCNLTKANYTDVKLVDANTGAVLTRSLDTTCVTGDQDISRVLVFNDRWQVGALQTRTVKVIADIGSFAPVTEETIKATLLASEEDDIRNIATGSYISPQEVVPSGNIVGATHRVYGSEAAATLAKSVAIVDSD